MKKRNNIHTVAVYLSEAEYQLLIDFKIKNLKDANKETDCHIFRKALILLHEKTFNINKESL